MKKVLVLVPLLFASLCLVGFQPSAPVSVITVATDGELFSYSVSEEYVGVNWLTEQYEPAASVPSWSHSGKTLAFAAPVDDTWMINFWQDGAIVEGFEVETEPWAIAWSPDDTALAFTTTNSYPKPFNVDVAHLDSGEVFRVTSHAAGCCVAWLSNNEVMFVDRPRDDADALKRGTHSIPMVAMLEGNWVNSVNPSDVASYYFDWSVELSLIDLLPKHPDMQIFEAAWNKPETLAAAYMNNQPSRNGRPEVKVVIYEFKQNGALGIRFAHSGELYGGFSWNPVTY